jgi:hypothetical protein
MEQSIKEESMKMMHTINRVIICGLTLAVVSFLSNAVAEEQTTYKEEGIVQQQEASKWGEAGKEVKEAAGSVAEATTPLLRPSHLTLQRNLQQKRRLLRPPHRLLPDNNRPFRRSSTPPEHIPKIQKNRNIDCLCSSQAGQGSGVGFLYSSNDWCRSGISTLVSLR